MTARTQAINALKALVVTAPEELREQLRTLSTLRLVRTTAELEPGAATSPLAAAKLLARFGIGVGLGRGAGGRRRRQSGPAPVRHCLCHAVWASPLEASSGKVRCHRLNRGGDRQANAALDRIVVARLRHDQQTRDDLARRICEGRSKKEAIRCLKRYVAREVFAVLRGNPRLQPAALPSP